MTFLTPLMLAGTALVAAPILLHLLMRQKPQLLEFPALRFLKQRQETTRKQTRLRHLLLLLMRCAGIALLALALARPSLQSSGLLADREAPVAAALIFDTSPRMQYRQENQTRLEAAQATGVWLMSQLPDDSQVSVVDSATDAAVFSADLGAARQRIERLSTAALARSLPQQTTSALELLETSDLVRKEIYIFTDLTVSGWPREYAAQLQAKVATQPEVSIYVIDIGILDPQNITLDDLQLSADVVPERGVVNLRTQLISTGTGTGIEQDDQQRSVAVFLQDSPGQTVKRHEQCVRLVPDGMQPVDFDLGGLKPGLNQGYVEIVEADGLPVDNRRYFSVEVQPPVQVLIAAASVQSQSARFLAEAIAPSSYNRRRFEQQIIDFEALNTQQLTGQAVVCLIDPPALSPTIWLRLRQYVQQGGSLAIWLGPSAMPLVEFNQPTALELLPGALRRRWGNQNVRLRPHYLEHPILAKFRAVDYTTWEAPVFSFWQFDDLRDGAQVILEYTGGEPALIEQQIGSGRVLTTTTTVSDSATSAEAWNALLLHPDPAYFVIVNEMLTYLVGSPRFNYALGETVVLPIDEEQAETVLTLTTPRDEQLQQAVNPQTGNLVFTATDLPGNYLATAGGTQGLRTGFSVNALASSTDLLRVKEDQLPLFFGEGRYRLARGQESLVREIGEVRVGRELFPYLIVLVALVLAAEYVLANRFYRTKASEPQALPRQAASGAISG